MRKFFIFFALLLPLLCTSCSLLQKDNEDAATYLNVYPTEILFSADGENSFSVDCDGAWILIASNKITLSTTSGESGITTVRILDMTASTIQTIEVRTPGNQSLAETVRVRPDNGETPDNPDTPLPDLTGETIYYDNFDGDESYNNWANQGTTWQNPTGKGAENVTYETNYTKIKNDNSYGSTGKYANASGKCYVNIYKPGDNIAYFEIYNIATNSEKNFTLSFGAMFKSSHCALYIKGDDSEWKTLEYTASATYDSWAVAKASFSLTNSVDKLSFRFESISAEATYGCNLDDLRLTTSEGGQTIDFGVKKEYRWAELPRDNPDKYKSEYVYGKHWATTYSSKKRVRNYFYCYDVRRHSPMWVAHPQHAIYQEGGKTRPATDPWACDPYLTDNESAIIYPIDGYACSLRTYEYGTYGDYYQWQRGHMLASSYRGCGDANNPAEINKQTFYSSNIAAQRSGENSAFQILWGAAERKILDSYVCSDTLYVVSGAHFANEDTKAVDARVNDFPDLYKTCIVPTHFYKIVLRTKKGNTGKAIQECSADELKAVGFWFSNTDVDEQTGSASPTLSKAHMRSIDEIEQLTGNEFDFFPDIPESVEASFNASEWGF